MFLAYLKFFSKQPTLEKTEDTIGDKQSKSFYVGVRDSSKISTTFVK